MSESKKMVHLLWTQKKQRKFSHPLLDNIPKPMDEETLDTILKRYFEGDIKARESLIFNYFRLLRVLIGRYLYYWPITRKFIDEMVSTGLEAIISVINDLTFDQLENQLLVKKIGNKIRLNIEVEVNKLRGIAPASQKTNFKLEKRGDDPIYGTIVTDTSKKFGKIDRKFDLVDIKDALANLAETDQEQLILAKENWGLPSHLVAQRTGIDARSVRRLRVKLLNRLKEELQK